ncbi:unnamed protein product (macronuclear) [Paramecium tetraurelia]|uniref:Protein kinase domain-containing protein n=1 Tax=Paramecium tetraurelia TaxID=5888 RepID=A0EH03_PARTE|nr:uncharacterized protein GSPATT00026918001 [Paramecium tetraurelia]CAK94594.1 unnamed protein product [Paramecium tetraurelia]|eukprot:XP_001461967.1 hypothetical protein (macronuclear) [Paramecium tetraurelia strain d4-2]
MLQISNLKDRLKCKIEFSEDEEEKGQIISLSSVDDALRFEDRYESQELLGQGAHAVVKLAKRKGTNDLFAVKIMRMNNEEVYNNVKRTFNNSRCLRHQNIIQEYELYINEKYYTASLVMEYCPYPSLEQILKDRVTLKEDEVRNIVKQLLMAVGHIHSKGISHRDIKPDNILVNVDGNCELKLLDFGVSRRFLWKNQHHDMLTKTGNIYYCAPEIYHQTNYSKEIDLWSIGVIMFQCMTGELPLQNENPSDHIELLSKPELWNFKNRIKGESLSAQNLISRLLQQDPKKRIGPQDALNHPFIEKNKIYTTLAMLSSTKIIDDDDNLFLNKCQSLQTSLSVDQKQSIHRALKTLHLGQEYQQIVLEDLMQELGNVHIIQRRNSDKCAGFIQLVNSLGNSQGVTISKVLDVNTTTQCNLGVGSTQSIVSSDHLTQDYFGDLGNIQSSVDLGNSVNETQVGQDTKKNTFGQFMNQMGAKIECSIDINLGLADSQQDTGFNNKFNQIISTLDVLGIKECDETVEDQQ